MKADCKWEKPEYVSNIQKTAPEFTTEINSRNLVVGYNGVLHCAVKGNPAPKISWFKNQLSILPKIGPKYRSCNQHGLIQLEVLRAKGRFFMFFYHFCSKISYFTPKLLYLSKISIFGQYYIFCRKLIFLTEIIILLENCQFCQKLSAAKNEFSNDKNVKSMTILVFTKSLPKMKLEKFRLNAM